LGIEYAGTNPIQAIILCTYPKGVKYASALERGRDRGRDQGHLEVRALLEQVEIKMEDKRCKPPSEV